MVSGHPELTYVDFNARDEFPYVLGLLVSSPTGVVYGNQCGGLACLWKEMEGYLVVLGGPAHAEPFISFFANQFDGRPPTAANEWPESILSYLSGLIKQRAHYYATERDGESESEIAVSLDRERLAELTEAWIPVRVGEGTGAIVFANSD